MSSSRRRTGKLAGGRQVSEFPGDKCWSSPEVLSTGEVGGAPWCSKAGSQPVGEVHNSLVGKKKGRTAGSKGDGSPLVKKKPTNDWPAKSSSSSLRKWTAGWPGKGAKVKDSIMARD